MRPTVDWDECDATPCSGKGMILGTLVGVILFILWGIMLGVNRRSWVSPRCSAGKLLTIRDGRRVRCSFSDKTRRDTMLAPRMGGGTIAQCPATDARAYKLLSTISLPTSFPLRAITTTRRWR
jgi:hypothetical protein